ncbi:carbohydrate porin [Variovorax terrae]|uniref:Carbohydrate porin n=1 Tax=Variovorax terrae TaxID=2923278 RepID=A0A9X2AP69_9BURK|nr:carbohydrate porin [Variovorax terrae]MCJ0761736.1 carbohydrate porin [Variovorax terrae]
MTRKTSAYRWSGALFLIAACAHSAWASTENEPQDEPALGFHAQATYIWQAKPAFEARYSGPNSLKTSRERSYSLTATGDLGLRLWQGGQLHFNPEAAQGVPLSNLTGAGGISNGELARTSGPDLTLYKARLFLQQRWNAGGELETIDPDFNELGGKATARRWTLTVGNFSLLDYFDNNPYAKDPREQFMNWSFLTHGAWDYAADARGYTIGAIIEYRTPQWSVRAGRVMMPRESNGLPLDWQLRRHYGDQIEVESDLPVALPAGPMRARLLLFRNRASMGSFSDALAVANGGVPDVADVRRDQTKTGWGLTLEAPLGPDAGLFLRTSRNNGQAETFAFTEIDGQTSVGGQFTGAAWGRANDRVGVALAVNTISQSHRRYLAAGGLGFFLGDGALNYAPERVFETYYRWVLPELSTRAGRIQSALSVGFQRITNPGYNQDRGPVNVYSVRWHSEF